MKKRKLIINVNAAFQNISLPFFDLGSFLIRLRE